MTFLLIVSGLTSSTSGAQITVLVGEDLDLTLTPENFQENEYIFWLPGGDNAEFQFEMINDQLSLGSVEYLITGPSLELLRSDATSNITVEGSHSSNHFGGVLNPDSSTIDLYSTAGLCCDCIKTLWLNFVNVTDDANFRLLYTVTNEGDTCNLWGPSISQSDNTPFFYSSAAIGLLVALLVRKYLPRIR